MEMSYLSKLHLQLVLFSSSGSCGGPFAGALEMKVESEDPYIPQIITTPEVRTPPEDLTSRFR